MWQPLISGESRCECLGVITVIFQLFCIIFFLKVGRENERIWDPKILYKMMQEKNEKKKKKISMQPDCYLCFLCYYHDDTSFFFLLLLFL